MLVLILCTFAYPASAPGQDQHGFSQRVFKDEQGEHRYALFVPKNYNPNRKWPVILYLHGAGERGKDGFLQTTAGLGPAVRRRAAQFPFLVVFPQVENKRGRIYSAWSADSPGGKRALAILKQVEQNYQVDPNRRILTGWSMGGYGAWSLAASHPELWSAVVPISGGGDPQSVQQLKSVPVWGFHGANDVLVQPKQTERMIAALNAAGTQPHYSLFSDTGHDVWKKVYENDALYDWMLKPKSQPETDPRAITKAVAKAATAYPAVELPFHTAVDISNALYARLGNNMLDSLAYSVPQQVPADLLSGRIRDMNDGTTVQGRYFRIAFRRISYRGEVSRVHLEAYAKDRLNIQLALKNIQLTIGSTSVRGQRHSASAGPIQISIGYRRPVWLSIAVKPEIQNRKIRFKLVATRFDIPRDNYRVSSPRGVSTQGLGMTRERVTSGLVNGLYSSKGRIESEVRAIVPGLLAELEKKMDLAPVSDVVTTFWPLPLYQPRLRVWPQSIAADENGISLMFGASIASIEHGSAQNTPQKFAASGQDVTDLSTSRELQVGLNPAMLEPMTRLLIDEDMARIHVLDLPIKEFHPFADRKQMEQWIPELANVPSEMELWSELVLQKPVNLAEASSAKEGAQNGAETSDTEVVTETSASDVSQIQFEIPELVLSLSLRNRNTGQLKPFANVRFHINQKSAITVNQPVYSERVLTMTWTGEPEIKADAQFEESVQPKVTQINSDALARTFRQGWQAWTQGGPVSQYAVRDVDFGYSKLRLGRIGWADSYLYAEFKTPIIKITNSFSDPFAYETKGPHSGWSEEYRLDPGKAHEFEVSYPLLYRRKGNLFTLPVGSHSEFREPATGGEPQIFKSNAP